jgi:hypothetical protein
MSSQAQTAGAVTERITYGSLGRAPEVEAA